MTSEKVLADFSVPSQAGNERGVAERVSKSVESLHLPEARRRQLETAVAEASMNAMEYGNQFQPDRLVHIQVLLSGEQLVVKITDQGGERELPEYVEPDLNAKLAGLQPARGWGLFLIKKMVDAVRFTRNRESQTLELVLNINSDINGA